MEVGLGVREVWGRMEREAPPVPTILPPFESRDTRTDGSAPFPLTTGAITRHTRQIYGPFQEVIAVKYLLLLSQLTAEFFQHGWVHYPLNHIWP